MTDSTFEGIEDSTFRVLRFSDSRSVRYEAYRAAWYDRGEAVNLDSFSESAPIHLDIETTATCDLKCGSNLTNPEGFCQVWTHEHLRKEGFSRRKFKPGFMDPADFYSIINDADDLGVKSVKLNFRGEPTLHPYIEEFVFKAASTGFADVMLNTNGNGGARKDPELFAKIVKNGIINLMFSVDACTPEVYHKQRVQGKWDLLLNSVRSAILIRDMGFGSPDCRIRVSAVRTKLNKDQIDSGQFEEFWIDKIGVDWASVSECYFPAGIAHDWQAAEWEQMKPTEFKCADPFRRMVVTWDLGSSLPCCQGFTKQVNGGTVIDDGGINLYEAWASSQFHLLRTRHRCNMWDLEPMCVECPLTKKVVEV